jgi:hypothetical protein
MATCKFCPNDEYYAILGVCKNCYAGLAYWRGRTQHDKKKRQVQLEKLNRRMDHLITNPRAVPHKRKKKATKKGGK